MKTTRDDDYLICRHYYDHIDNVHPDYPDFITFKHNDNYYFAWVNDGKVILRSEAYPDMERTIRGIKAVIKNRDIHERYSVDSQHGVHFLQLWGGGDHQKHTGNMDQHNEIGRSCPAKDLDELYALTGFLGPKFKDKVYGGLGLLGTATAAAAAITSTPKPDPKPQPKKVERVEKVAPAAITSKEAVTRTREPEKTGGGFKWWWLLPLLLLPLLFFIWKGCGDKKVVTTPVKPKVETKAPEMDAAELKLKEEEAARLAAEKEQAAMEKAKAEEAAAAAAAEKEAKRKKRQREERMYSGGNKASGY